MKYLKFHEDSLELGRMAVNDDFEACARTSGLCDAFGHVDEFRLFIPTEEDFYELTLKGKNNLCWASDSRAEKYNEYTPLRQNIVLLMAAMAGELE